MVATKPTTIDGYIATFPDDVQQKMEQVRSTIRKAAPAAEERISYGIAAFNLNGQYLIYFAGYKNHIGLYPVPSGVKEFEKDFAAYKTSGKGAIQFPLDKPMPLSLITKIVKYRIKSNAEKAKKKLQKK